MMLYHFAFDTDREALQALARYRDTVHTLGGYLWTSLSHGVGSAYVIVALPADTAWEPLTGKQAMGFLSDFSALQLLDPYGPVVPINAALFGAVGDGVTDDTPAIQAAVDAVTSLGPVETPAEQPDPEETTDVEPTTVAW